MSTSNMEVQEPFIDVVELCVFLQCMGFKVKSLDMSDGNLSQEEPARSVVVNCQSSGLHVVLESGSVSCSCPPTEQQNSGFWQVSGVSGGKQADKKSGSALLGTLPQKFRDQMSQQLADMVRLVREVNINESYEQDVSGSARLKDGINKSASMIEMKSPDKKSLFPKVETPTRYRSLDTLTSNKTNDELLPDPGPLQKHPQNISSDDVKTIDSKENVQTMCRRQSTYTISSTPPGCVRRRNKTSSPIQGPSNLMDSLITAEKAAEELYNTLSAIVKEFMDNGKNDSSISLALDVSKISVVKGTETSKATYASSPNLSGIASLRDDVTKSRLKRFESVSTSNLARPIKDGRVSKLVSRISPGIFKKKDTAAKTTDLKSKLNAIKPKIVTPVRIPKKTVEPSPSLSSSKKKFSNIKSTIPRPTPAKKE